MRPHVRLWPADTGDAEALTNVATSGWSKACKGQVRPGCPPLAVPLCSHTSSLLAGAQIGAWALESTAPEAVRGCTRPQASGRSWEVPFGQRLPVAMSQVVGSGLHCPQPTLGSVTPERVQTWFTQSLGEKCRLVIFIRTLQDYKVLLISPPISTLDVICLYHLPSFLLDSFS